MKTILSLSISILLIGCQSDYADYNIACSDHTDGKSQLTYTDSVESFQLEYLNTYSVLKPFGYAKAVFFDSASFELDSSIYMMTIENYKLDKNQTFEEFNENVTSRTQQGIKEKELQDEFFLTTTNFILNDRKLKRSITKDISRKTTYYTGQHYIQNLERVFVVTFFTNRDSYQQFFCQNTITLKSIRTIEGI